MNEKKIYCNQGEMSNKDQNQNNRVLFDGLYDDPDEISVINSPSNDDISEETSNDLKPLEEFYCHLNEQNINLSDLKSQYTHHYTHQSKLSLKLGQKTADHSQSTKLCDDTDEDAESGSKENEPNESNESDESDGSDESDEQNKSEESNEPDELSELGDEINQHLNHDFYSSFCDQLSHPKSFYDLEPARTINKMKVHFDDSYNNNDAIDQYQFDNDEYHFDNDEENNNAMIFDDQNNKIQIIDDLDELANSRSILSQYSYCIDNEDELYDPSIEDEQTTSLHQRVLDITRSNHLKNKEYFKKSTTAYYRVENEGNRFNLQKIDNRLGKSNLIKYIKNKLTPMDEERKEKFEFLLASLNDQHPQLESFLFDVEDQNLGHSVFWKHTDTSNVRNSDYYRKLAILNSISKNYCQF